MTVDDGTLESYDAVPYVGRAITLTHPCRLAAVARLSGLEPPPPDRCRVLELGCAVGSNLLPMAESLPDSRFVGVDFSPQQIERAWAVARRAGIGNVELVAAAIEDVDERLGRFDYIVCHGVYSWVRSEVRERMLALGPRLLGPQGLMVVSYNTYPGWHLRGAIREMMLRHVADRPAAAERIAAASGLIRFLAEHARPGSASYAGLLKEELQAIEFGSDHYLFHDYLEINNAAEYFEDFVARAAASGLAYVADADITTMFAQHFGDAASAMLLQAPLVRREQYMDFLRGRMFRTSILRLPERTPDADCGGPTSLAALHVRLAVAFDASEVDGERVWKHRDRTMRVGPAASALLRRLRRTWPAWTAVAELLDDGDGGEPLQPSAKESLLGELFTALSHGAVVAAEAPPPLAALAAEAPRCTPLARVQAVDGEWVASRHHQSVLLDPPSRFLLPHLDGTKRLAELAALLQRAVLSGDLLLAQGDAAAARADREGCAQIVARRLALLAHGALLID